MFVRPAKSPRFLNRCANCARVLLVICAILSQGMGQTTPGFLARMTTSAELTFGEQVASCRCCCAAKGSPCSCAGCGLSLSTRQVRTNTPANSQTATAQKHTNSTVAATQWESCQCDTPTPANLARMTVGWLPSQKVQMGDGEVNGGRYISLTEPIRSRTAPQPPTPPPRVGNC